jgi:drug/metabolite transporter (DMT)-like permease
VNRDRPTAGQLAGAGLILAGLVGVAIAQTASVADLWWLGLVFAFGAGTTYALANALTRIVQRERPLLFVTLAISNLGGAVPLALIIGTRAAAGETIAVDAASVAAVLLAGCANAVALLSLTLAVRAAPIATVNTISSASIIFSFVASVTIFGEVGTSPMVVGIALVTAGIVVAQLRRRADAVAPDEPPVEPAYTPSGDVIRRK